MKFGFQKNNNIRKLNINIWKKQVTVLFQILIKKTNYLITLAIFVTPIIIFLRGERVAMTLFFLMLSYYLVFFIRSQKFKFIYFYVVFSILGTVALLYSSDTYYDRYINQTYKSLFNKTIPQNKHLILQPWIFLISHWIF